MGTLIAIGLYMTLVSYKDIFGRYAEDLEAAPHYAEPDSQTPNLEPCPKTRETLRLSLIAHDPSTYEHSKRVRRWAALLARQASVSDRHLLAAIDAAALLHDVGKLEISVRLLNKPGPLTLTEY